MPAITGIQILLAAVIVTLTGLLVFIGVQVVFILKDARRAVRKANRVLDRSSERISTASFLSQLIGAKPQVISENKMPTDELLPKGAQNPFGHIQALQERGRDEFGRRPGWTSGPEGPRVFHREGKPLA